MDEKIRDLALEIWATAQLLPNEGIEDGVARIEEILNTSLTPFVEASKTMLEAWECRAYASGIVAIQNALEAYKQAR